jgi:hypothetical protein
VTSLTIAGKPTARKDGGLAPSSDQAYKLTPLAASEIVAILSAEFSSTAFPVYQCGAAQRQAVGPPFSRTTTTPIHTCVFVVQ